MPAWRSVAYSYRRIAQAFCSVWRPRDHNLLDVCVVSDNLPKLEMIRSTAKWATSFLVMSSIEITVEIDLDEDGYSFTPDREHLTMAELWERAITDPIEIERREEGRTSRQQSFGQRWSVAGNTRGTAPEGQLSKEQENKKRPLIRARPVSQN